MSTERETMTLEQVRELAATGAACSSRSSLVPERWADIRDAIDVHLAREKAEPVYQIYAGGNWRDYTREEYEATEIKTKRIVYTHPIAPAEAEIERLRAGYVRLRDASDIEMADGDLARHIAREMLR